LRRLLVIGALAAVASGCGSGSRSGSLDPQVATAYVDAQAHALCVVQSSAFQTQAKQEAAYERAQQDSRLSADEFAEAQAAAAKDQALRERVSDRVVALCG
jgi:stalled ribosome rescue protein Dom34